MAYGLNSNYKTAPYVIDRMHSLTKQRIFLSNAAGAMIAYLRIENINQKRYVALTKTAAAEGAQNFIDENTPAWETKNYEASVRAEPRHVAGRTWELDTEVHSVLIFQEDIAELEGEEDE